MKPNNAKQIVQPTPLQRVLFKDGMIVTADDLLDATTYPLDVFKTLIRAFFGCGIVCGLKVKPGPADADGHSWCLEIEPGVALDCSGHPLELCKPVKFDLYQTYLCDPKPPLCMCIAMRRCTTDEEPRPNPGCSSDKRGADYDCTRVREQVLIKVFDPTDSQGRPKTVCMADGEDLGCSCEEQKSEKSQEYAGQAKSVRSNPLETFCECIKTCPDKACCGDAWVLLACVELDDCGIVCVQNKLRKYVKPIGCLCPPEDKVCIDRHPTKKNDTTYEPERKQVPVTKKPVTRTRSSRQKAE